MTHDTAGPDPSAAMKPQFDTAIRGYERSQVDEHLGRLHQETNKLAASLRQERDLALNRAQQLMVERDRAVERLRSAQQEPGSRADAPAGKKDEVSLFGARLQTILTTAEQEAAALKAEADEAARQARTQADQDAAATRGEASRQADALLTRARDEAASTLDAARAEAESTLTAARTEAETTLTAARTEADSTLTAARTEADSTLTAARSEAASTLGAARQEADTTVSQARERAAELTGTATAEAERTTRTARQQATAMVDAARREEAEVRDSLAELVQRRELVRRELTEINSVIEQLLTPLGDQDTDPAADRGTGANLAGDLAPNGRTTATQQAR